MKKIIGWLIIIILLAGTVCGVIFGVKYYTFDLDSALEVEYDKGYSDALNGSEGNYRVLYKEAMEKLSIAQNNFIELQEKYEIIKTNNETDKATLIKVKEELEQAKEEIFNLTNDVKFYEELLEAYEDSNKLIVTFMLFDDGKEIPYEVQAIEPNAYLSAVVTPEKDDFEGWALTKGGEFIDDLTTMQVTENMTIYGMCTNTVTFMVNGEEYTTQEVSYGEYATDIDVSLWGYTLEGWSLSENGETITIETTPVTANTNFYAILQRVDFSPIEWNGLSNFDGNFIWSYGENTYYSRGSEQYVLNKETRTWEKKIWYGVSEFNSSVIYSNNENAYLLSLDGLWVLEGDTWVKQEHCYVYTNLLGSNVWTDGEDYYVFDFGGVIYQFAEYSDGTLYVIKTSQTLPSNTSGSLWTDGENIYSSYLGDNYVFNKNTKKWEVKTWYGLTDFSGSNVWTDGENIYYSEYTNATAFYYVLDVETSTWVEKAWAGLNVFNGNCIWTDGENIYYSYMGENYILV